MLEGAKLAFGQPVETRYDLSKADVIVSLDADFLYAGFPGNTRYIRDFAKRRNPDSGNMNRLYVIESTPTTTGAKADHRLPARGLDVERFARPCRMEVTPYGKLEIQPQCRKGRFHQEEFNMASLEIDLVHHRGAGVIVVGDQQPPSLHALAHVLNEAFGHVGKTVFYTDPVDASPVNQTESMKDLVADMRGGKVDLLSDPRRQPGLRRPRRPELRRRAEEQQDSPPRSPRLYQDETAELCHWHVNATHELEAWGDARAYDGTVSIIQPLIAPLYNGKSALEFTALVSGQSDATGYDSLAPTGRSSIPARTSNSSGASRFTMAGLRARPSLRSQ